MTLITVGEKISAEVTEELSHRCIYKSFDLLKFIEINGQFSHKYIYVRFGGVPRPRIFCLVLHVLRFLFVTGQQASTVRALLRYSLALLSGSPKGSTSF